MAMENVIIRDGTSEDLPEVFNLIKELAGYEKAPNEVTNTVEQMRRDGFGPRPIFGFYVAAVGNKLVGLSLYYYRYSTWKGRRLYLEDIIVTEHMRRSGIGKLLFERTMAKSLDEGCTGMMWQVLDWNQPAFSFYNQYHPKIDNTWVNFSLEADQIKELLRGGEG